MKRILILASATIIFASCSKEYTCDCVNPETDETNQMVFLTNKKAHATRLCDDWGTRIRAAVANKDQVTCTIK